MKVDFWQLSRDPPETVVPLIATRVLAQGDRLLIVSDDADQRTAISSALWKADEESFLANGDASSDNAARQPILLANDCAAPNGASHAIFADGTYRETQGFERVFLLFDDDATPAARRTWKALSERSDLERAFFRQDGGKWVKVA